MITNIPWILISLIVILAGVIIVGYVFRKQIFSSENGVFKEIHKPAFFIQFTVGLLCCLCGAIFMFNGELFGKNTSGVAQIIGIVGICLIASATPVGMAIKKKL